MKKKNKKEKILIITTVIILLIIIAVITLLFSSNSNKNKDEDKNNSNDIYNIVTLDNLSININKLNYSEGFTEVILDIKNNYSEAINIDTIKLIFKDKNNNTINEMYATYESSVEPSEIISINTYIDADISTATKVDYELVGDDNNEA